MKSLKTGFLLLPILFFASCSDKSESPAPNNYPKQVSVTYKVTSSSTAAAAVITYTGLTGSPINEPSPALPYTKTFTRTVNLNDVISLGYGTNLPQQVKLDILVDNVAVKTESFTSTSGAIVYTFR